MAHELCRAGYKQLPGLFYTGSPADNRFRNKNMKYGKCEYIIAVDEDKKFRDSQRCDSLLRKKAGVPEKIQKAAARYHFQHARSTNNQQPAASHRG